MVRIFGLFVLYYLVEGHNQMTIWTRGGRTTFIAKLRHIKGGIEINISDLNFIISHAKECWRNVTFLNVFAKYNGFFEEDFECNELENPGFLETRQDVEAFMEVPLNCRPQKKKCNCALRMITPQTGRFLNWQVAFRNCISRKSYQISLQLKIVKLNYTCKELQKGDTCSSYFSHGLVSSGMSNGEGIFLSQASIALIIQMFIWYGSNSCYQHGLETVCRVQYPNCEGRTDRFQYICKEACDDLVAGCDHISSNSGFIPSLSGICKVFRPYSSDQCWYRNLSCGELPEIKNGHSVLNVSKLRPYAVFSCDSGYTLSGSPTIPCHYTGHWSKVLPKCVASPVPVTTLLVGMVTTFLCVVITVVLAFTYRLELVIFLYVRLGVSITKNSEPDKEFAAMVISTGVEADDFVSNTLLPELETNRGYELFATVRDETLGATLRQDCDAVMNICSRAIFVVNRDFMDNMTCLNIFEETESYEKYVKGFRIIVLLDKTISHKQVGNKALAAYIRTKSYIYSRGRFFLDRLVYALPHGHRKT